MPSRTPGPLEALEIFLNASRVDTHVALPGRVESYDADKQVADVKPMVKRVARDQDDVRSVDSLQVLSAVPVAFPRGGGYLMTFPLAAGDTGLLVFCERDIGAWRASGQDSDPSDEGLHTLAGAVFYPGLHTEANALASRPDHLVLAKDGGPELHVGSTTVDVGAEGGDAVVKATTAFNTWINAVSSFCSLTAPPDYKATKAKAT